MKIYIYMLLFVNFIFAQQQPPVLSTTSLADANQKLDHPKNGNYAVDTNNERAQYIGTWEYNQNGILFQLKIESVNKVLSTIESNGIVDKYNFADEIIFRYKLVKNGVTLYNNLNAGFVDYNTNWAIKYINYEFAKGQIMDYTRNVIGSAKIKRLNTIPPKILFNLSLFNAHKLNDPSYYEDGQPLFSLPTGEIEMIKIN
jgi:hypothetical protein